MKARQMSLDIINTLPPNIVENILCLVPIQEAVRTCILSKEWRYNWTKIPKLSFVEDTYKESTDENHVPSLDESFDSPSERKYLTPRSKLFNAIFQVLLFHEGPIYQFSLYVKADDSCVEIDQIIRHLARKNTLQKIELVFNSDGVYNYRLPLSIFSLHHLTHIYLHKGHLVHQPTFRGFGNLTSLFLRCVKISIKTLLHLLSSCPLLKDFNMLIDSEYVLGNDNCSVVELFKCLPMIEHLFMWEGIFECFAQDGVPRVLPTKLMHLAEFLLDRLSFSKEHSLPFLGLVLRSSPTLEKLLLTIDQDPYLEEYEIESVSFKDYSDIRLEHLNEVVIRDFIYSEYELEFVKLILVKSPVLKKVSIFLYDEVVEDEGLLRRLLQSPRASPLVEIIVVKWNEQ